MQRMTDMFQKLIKQLAKLYAISTNITLNYFAIPTVFQWFSFTAISKGFSSF